MTAAQLSHLVIDADWAADHPPMHRCLAVWWPNWSSKNGASLFCGTLAVGNIMAHGVADGMFGPLITWEKWVDSHDLMCPNCQSPVLDPRFADRIKGNFLVMNPTVIVLDAKSGAVLYNPRDYPAERYDAQRQVFLRERPEWGSMAHVAGLAREVLQMQRKTTWLT